MPVASAPVSAIFILVAASTAVVVSMVVLALFDRAFRKKKPAAANKENDHQRLVSSRRTTGMGRSKPKPSAVLRHYSKARHQAGCGPQTQRIKNFAQNVEAVVND